MTNEEKNPRQYSTDNPYVFTGDRTDYCQKETPIKSPVDENKITLAHMFDVWFGHNLTSLDELLKDF